MKYWLDNIQYRQRRRLAIDFSILCRAYYEGHPYSIGKFNQAGMIRLNLLENFNEVVQDKQGKPTYIGPEHQYEYNIAKLRIDQMVKTILPQQAQLIIEGIGDDEDGEKTKEYIRTVLNPGGKYPATLSGLKQWMRSILLDAAQVGDRLGIPRFMPKSSDRENPFVLLTTFPSCDWDAELERETNEPLFFRIEYREAGENGREYWRRFDIYRDHIKRYQPQMAETQGLPTWDLLYPGLMDWDKAQPFYFPGDLKEAEATPESNAEAAAMKEMSDFIAVPIRYDDRGVDSFRGLPEILITDMRAIDKANRHLAIWSNAIEDTNFPSLIVWDATFPKNADGTANTQINLRAGSQHQLSSALDQPGRAEYPDNMPTQFAFAEFLDQIATIAFGSIPNRGLKPEDVRAFSQMSGFAHQIIARHMDDRVKDFCENAIENGILPLFRCAHEMAKIKGILPPGTEDVSFSMTYGVEPVSADEGLKQMLVCKTALEMKIPPKFVVPQIPMRIDNAQEVIDAMEEDQANAMAMDEALTKAKLAPPVIPPPPGQPIAVKTPEPKDQAGVDNNAR